MGQKTKFINVLIKQRICLYLDSTSNPVSLVEMSEALPRALLLDEFQLLQPEAMGKLLLSVGALSAEVFNYNTRAKLPTILCTYLNFQKLFGIPALIVPVR